MSSSPHSRRSPLRCTSATHLFDHLTDFCTQCGAHRSSIWLEEWPRSCPAAENVIGISHLLARRAVSAGSAMG
jgi:hypothetical protein